jgi:hypothetical protein
VQPRAMLKANRDGVYDAKGDALHEFGNAQDCVDDVFPQYLFLRVTLVRVTR